MSVFKLKYSGWYCNQTLKNSRFIDPSGLTISTLYANLAYSITFAGLVGTLVVIAGVSPDKVLCKHFLD